LDWNKLLLLRARAYNHIHPGYNIDF